MASVAYTDIQAFVNPASVSTVEMATIISLVTTEVLTKSGATDATNPFIYLAILHGSIAATIKKARSNGELAASVETPDSKISNTGLIDEIKQHDEKMDEYIQQYKDSVRFANGYGFIPTGRMGFGTVNGE